MTAPDDVRACPFCGNAKMEIHHNTQAGITFLLCGDDRGRGGCGAVVSFRPNLTGSKAIQAYNRRAYITPCGGCGNDDPEKRCLNCGHDFNAAHADSGEVREMVEALKLAKRAYWLARNSAAGLTNYCEESASSRRCERELSEAEALWRSAGVETALAKHTHQEKP